MAKPTRIIAIGDSAGIILPKEILDRLKVQPGDTVYVAETPVGMYISACDDQRIRKLESIEGIAHKHREALHKLAD